MNQEHDVFLGCCTTCLRQVSIQLLDLSPHQSGLLFLSGSVGDFIALGFELCLCKGVLGLGDPPFLQIAR